MIKMEESIRPLKIDFSNARNKRQQINNELVFNAIKSNNISLLITYCNMKELNRVLDEIEITLEELMKLCSDNNIMNKIFSLKNIIRIESHILRTY